ncbi:hypothetical protein GCM10028803_28640 [Larkinella knui]|uniref:TetR/AcrR family transcriptional regulator n=1 Tax=Larkinella knui TaxID=2025310 RepID=A0A3P1CXT9_9BACT|nr:TetR/AcrR family transcriptional regulator [Larkinella knui]RRB17900.1 TetR/AcrR family transcriptional regulator [Larkinella knui]
MIVSFCDRGPEEQIKEAAKKVFLEKGFDGATMKEIAHSAGMNSALTHYYFRSKERLFWLVFEGLLKELMDGMQYTLDMPTSLREKIGDIVEQQYQFHRKNPSLVLFLMSEAQRDPVGLFEKMGARPALKDSYFFKQVEEAIQLNLIRPVSPIVLLSIVFSSIKQVFAGKALQMHLFNLDEAGFAAYLEEYKNISITMLLNYLYKQ